MPELARGLAVRLIVPGPTVDSALDALRAGPAVQAARALAQAVGCRLRITDSALGRLARAVDAGVLSLADAERALVAAARRAVAGALADATRARSVAPVDLLLAPDDLGTLGD